MVERYIVPVMVLVVLVDKVEGKELLRSVVVVRDFVVVEVGYAVLGRLH